MPSYYDVISQETREINADTILYLIQCNELFYIKCIASGIDQLSNDPTTRAKKYWLIDAAQLLNKSLNDSDVKNSIFPNNQLTESPLSSDKIEVCLGFYPQAKDAKDFNNSSAQQISSQVEARLTQNTLYFFGSGVGGLFRRDSRARAIAPAIERSSALAGGIEEGLLREGVIGLRNFWHTSALAALETRGLTAEMLLNRNENGHEFTEDHAFALRDLVLKRSLTIQAALEIIDGLSSAQAGGIEKGLLREDVIGLRNFWHISALTTLKTRGLTAERLLNRNENGHEFTESHSFALHNLVLNRGFTIQAALEMIDGLSSVQADGIKEGLLREDVMVRNVCHISALQMLKTRGLTAEMLLNRNENGHKFTEHHTFALRDLVLKRSLTIQAALEIIDGLSSAQAGGIEKGLLREDVIGLRNFWHITALQILKTRGLTAEMLLTRNENGHEFTEDHTFALRNLVLKRSLTVQAALEIIDGLSSAQAGHIEDNSSRSSFTVSVQNTPSI